MAIDPNVARTQAQIDTNPAVQQALQWYRERGGQTLSGKPSRTHPGGRALMDEGIELPHDYRLTSGGQLDRLGLFERNPWLKGTLMAGGLAAGGLAAGYFGGAGAGASAGTGVATGAGTGAGVGAGTLAATTPALTTGVLAPTVTSSLAGGGGGMLSALLSNPETYATAASLLGRVGQGGAAERSGENRFAQDQDRERNSIFRTQQQAALEALLAQERGSLDRAQLGISAPAARTRQSVLGSILQNVQPVSVNVPDRVRGSLVSYEGGLSPALLNSLARESGGELQRQAHGALVNKSDIPAPTNFQSGLLTPPNQTPYQGPGALETGASAGATAASIGGILAALLANRNRPAGQAPPDDMGGG